MLLLSSAAWLTPSFGSPADLLAELAANTWQLSLSSSAEVITGAKLVLQMHLHDLAMARKQQAGFAQALRKTPRSSLVQASTAAAAAADGRQAPASPSSQSAESDGRGSSPQAEPPHPDLQILPPQGGQFRPLKPVLDDSKVAALGEARREPWTTGRPP